MVHATIGPEDSNRQGNQSQPRKDLHDSASKSSKNRGKKGRLYKIHALAQTRFPLVIRSVGLQGGGGARVDADDLSVKGVWREQISNRGNQQARGRVEGLFNGTPLYAKRSKRGQNKPIVRRSRSPPSLTECKKAHKRCPVKKRSSERKNQEIQRKVRAVNEEEKGGKSRRDRSKMDMERPLRGIHYGVGH